MFACTDCWATNVPGSNLLWHRDGCSWLDPAAPRPEAKLVAVLAAAGGQGPGEEVRAGDWPDPGPEDDLG